MDNGKICKKCNLMKVLSEFQKHKNCKKDGHKGTCKFCVAEYKKKYYKDNKEKTSLKSKERYEQIKDTTEFILKRKVYQEKTKENKKVYDELYREENKEKIEKTQKIYYQEHKEERSSYRKKWYADNQNHIKNYRKENREYTAKRNKKYWFKNKEKQKKCVSEWRKENKERIKKYRKDNFDRDKEKAREWMNTPRGRSLTRLRVNVYRSKKRSLEHSLTVAEWDECISYFSNRCAYCGKEEKLEQEHFIPVTKDGPLTKGNIVTACRACNASKSNHDFKEWYHQKSFYSRDRERKILEYLGNEKEIEV